MKNRDTERLVLFFDPFSGDDLDVRVMSDKMLVCRKSGMCAICFEQFTRGDRVRARVELFDGKVKTFRFCPRCCDAMAKQWSDNGIAIEKRYAIGQHTAMRKEKKP